MNKLILHRIPLLLLIACPFLTYAQSPQQINYFSAGGEVCLPVTVKYNHGQFTFYENNYRIDGSINYVEAWDCHGRKILDTTPKERGLWNDNPKINKFVFTILYPQSSQDDSQSISILDNSLPDDGMDGIISDNTVESNNMNINTDSVICHNESICSVETNVDLSASMDELNNIYNTIDSDTLLNINEMSLIHTHNAIDELYNVKFDIENPSLTYDSTKSEIASLINKLSSQQIIQLQENYLDSFYNASDEEQLDIAICNAFKYLMLEGQKDQEIICQVLVDNYGCEGDDKSVVFLLGIFKEISRKHNNAFSEIIDSLSQKYRDIVNPVSVEDLVKGYWISIDDATIFRNVNLFKNCPDYILNIIDITRDDGSIMLSSPTYLWKSAKYNSVWVNRPNIDNYMLRISQATLCVDSLPLHLTFASEKLREGNTNLSRQNLERNRQWKANMHGKIESSDGSFGEKLLGGVATEVVGGLLDAFFIGMGSGSKMSEGYGIELSIKKPHLMDARITYRKVKTSSLGYSSTKDYKPNQPNRFVKWEESDSIIFISSSGDPIFIGSISNKSPLLKEYNEVRKKYNFWKPQYFIPSLISLGLGAACITRGITMLTHDIRENRNLPESEKKDSTFSEILFLTAGTMIPTLTIGIISSSISSKRQSSYDNINKANMTKMRHKASEMSFNPIFNPNNNSIGMNVSVIF